MPKTPKKNSGSGGLGGTFLLPVLQFWFDTYANRWGLGGVTGAIVGGACTYHVLLYNLFLTAVSVERPATKWPGVFEDLPLFKTYPYLLPCAVAALITFIGE